MVIPNAVQLINKWTLQLSNKIRVNELNLRLKLHAKPKSGHEQQGQLASAILKGCYSITLLIFLIIKVGDVVFNEL